MNQVKDLIATLVWYPKQLLPLTYRTKYDQDGKKYFVVWRMWFGRCFAVEEYEINGPNCYGKH